MKSLLAIALVGAAMAPCIWDSDTLDTELRGLPDALDLVVGKWHRHGEAYYRQRVTQLAEKDPLTLGECDDLAVAYERLGERDQAVAVMARKAALLDAADDEEHRYRYHANLGTFHAHAGRYDEALVELRAAVARNPDAHFGRERYQIELIEFVAAAKEDPALWQRFSFLRHAGYQVRAFIGAEGLRYRPDRSRDWGDDWRGERALDWDEAYKAVAGMLRFGGLEGPELYRSLAELFLMRQHLNLAWWALERAIERGHPARELLRRGQRSIEAHWDEARKHNGGGHVAPTSANVAAKRAAADAWLAAFQRLEAAALERGDDVRSDAALRGLLDAASAEVADREPRWPKGVPLELIFAAGGVGLFISWMVMRRARG
jgi:tetratricopeptide (TPR) repeat protein